MKFLSITASLSFLTLSLCSKNILPCDNMNFSGKVVIVTGGSSGIGASTAIQFAKAGACVTIVGRNETRLNQVADKISQVGKPALVVRADLSIDKEARQVIQKTVGKYGKIDVLVNCAGFTTRAKISDKKYVKIFDSVLNVNLRAIVVLTNCAIPYLKNTKGNIVNIASTAARMYYTISGAHYATSKAALVMFTKSCAMELADFGIRTNTVSPGGTNTNFYKTLGYTNVDIEAGIKGLSPLGILIQPEEIADAVLYLASDKARSITGSDFVVDAGNLINDPYAYLAN